jgi:hypothetical protein
MSAVAVLATRPAVPAKLAFNVRPFGSTAVSVTVHDATPGVALGTGAHTPLFDNISLTTGEVTVIGPSMLGAKGMATFGAVRVTVAVVDCPTTIEDDESVTVNEVVAGTTVYELLAVEPFPATSVAVTAKTCKPTVSVSRFAPFATEPMQEETPDNASAQL